MPESMVFESKIGMKIEDRSCSASVVPLQSSNAVRRTPIVRRLPPEQADAATLRRSHWAIENKTFRVRDMVFGDDRCRMRTGRAAENLSILKNVAINYLRARKTDNIAATLRKTPPAYAPQLLSSRIILRSRFASNFRASTLYYLIRRRSGFRGWVATLSHAAVRIFGCRSRKHIKG